MITSISGEKIPVEDFKVETMVPFFGSQSKQNTYEYANKPLLENFTGSSDLIFEKSETTPFFNPTQNNGNIYGTQVMDDSVRNRYIQSEKKQSELPFEQIKVG